MTSTEATPRYRNFSNNMPSSIIQTPRAPSSSLIAVEKEPERDPEVDCFMCRQAHVYIKPIGMHQEKRVARRHPPPLTRTQIDELSRKKQLTKLEARKLLQCYFPEIKDVKYFQLHKYHSCCYDPKHLNLCKNHITALQKEREEYPHHQHHHQNGHGPNDNPYKDFERQGSQPNRVSFVRIKIEPTKGIPTRFLGPTVLPESLADMLIKQVNRLEDKKPKPSRPYNVRRVNNTYGSSDDDDANTGDDDDDEDDDNDSDDDGHNHETAKRGKSTNGDLVVEDLDELNRLYINREDGKDLNHHSQTFSKPLKKKKRKKGTKKSYTHGHQKSKLNHWELMALEQSKQETCNCRHHVMRLEADQIVYDWCRCKDHQHKAIMDRAPTAVPPPPAPPEEPVQPPPPQPKPRAKPRPKPRKVQSKSIGIDATEPTTTELALAYDPSAVDYDMIQEVIYYRTSSGRLIKPEISNAFTYDSMPPAMDINHRERNANRSEVLYMTSNGQLKPLEGGTKRLGKNTDRSAAPKSITLSHPGSLYGGHAFIDPEHSSSNTAGFGGMPVLKLPPSMTSSRQHSSGQNSSSGHKPAEFTLAKFSPDKSVGTPSSRRSITSSTQGKSRSVPMTLQKSSKPTYSNLEPTPDYGRESSVVANRRWFDQPLGDQNLRPVHDGQYGLIAGTATDEYGAKVKRSENEYIESETPTNKNGSNCTIS